MPFARPGHVKTKEHVTAVSDETRLCVELEPCLYLANFHWFSVVWTLIYHDLRHHMVKMLWTYEAQPW
jgi:hypothetical protein